MSVPDELIEIGQRAINELDASLLAKASEGHPWAEEQIARAVLCAVSEAGWIQRPTHVCVDCGALGYAGGYHDHGDGNAGDTVALADFPTWARSWQAIEDERDEARAEADRLAEALEAVRACMEWCVNLGADEQTAMSLRRGRSVANTALREYREHQ